MKLLLHLHLGLTALLLAGCKPTTEEDKLPAATQTGANTGGYLLNGQAIVANGIPGANSLLSSTRPTPALGGEFLNDSTLVIGLTSQYCSQRYYLELFVRCNKPGIYYFNRKTARYPGFDSRQLRSHAYLILDGASCEKNDGSRYLTYLTDSLHTGSVTISSMNRASGTAAGTFEFSAYSWQGLAPIQLTKGRFDFKR